MTTLLLLAGGIVLVPRFILANPVINEVLFDPAGTDTGLEKIELYNPGVAPLDMSGWELYPDGIGYFTFPNGFSLPAGSLAVIHLRTSGANDAANLYHPSAGANMGNSSGSVAVFKSGGRSQDTIADFVRYHKPGSSERKTWESTAADAGLWTTGQFVDISAIAEGNSIGLVSDGVRGGSSSWKIFATPSIGRANAETPGVTPTPQASPVPTPTSAANASADFGKPVTPSLKADAGPDAKAIAGAVIEFRGMAFGFDGEPLPGTRFLWNFGDGSVQEGRNLTHVYYFPGEYHASLNISSGEYSGSDWKTITVVRPNLSISEVMPGDDGFVELFNSSSGIIDASGININDGFRNVFRLPAGTLIGGGSAVVFPNKFTGLNPFSSLSLRDARNLTLEEINLSGKVAPGASWERSGGSFLVQSKPTPGEVNRQIAAEIADQKLVNAFPASAIASGTSPSSESKIRGAAAVMEKEVLTARADERASPSTSAASAASAPSANPGFFLSFSRRALVMISFAVSFLTALAFLFLKRKML